MWFWILVIVAIIALFVFRHNKNSDTDKSTTQKEKTSEPNSRVIEKARIFVSMCKKLDRLSGRPSNYYSVIKKESTYSADFYIEYRFHDVNELEFAYNAMKKGDTRMVRHYYDLLTREDLQLTTEEMGFFLSDYSDFCDFLYGGIKGFNTSTLDVSDIIIEQHIGCCSESEIWETYKELKIVTNNVF